MSNDTQSEIVIPRYAEFGGGVYKLRKGKTTMAHEIVHFLLDNVDGGSGDGSEHALMVPFVLMSRTGGDAYPLRLDEITDMQTNSDENTFIDRF